MKLHCNPQRINIVIYNDPLACENNVTTIGNLVVILKKLILTLRYLSQYLTKSLYVMVLNMSCVHQMTFCTPFYTQLSFLQAGMFDNGFDVILHL